MASAPDPITSPPDVPGQPWSATAGGSVGKWEKTKDAGAASPSGEISGGWPDNGDSGDGGWEQT